MPVKVHVSPVADLDFRTKNFQYQILPFSELVAKTMATNHEEYFMSPTEMYYLRSISDKVRAEQAFLSQQFPELDPDVRLPAHLETNPELIFSSALRVASAKLRLWTHYDTMDNILMNICGRKQVICYSPFDSDYLYLSGDKSVVTNPDEYDVDEFPLYSKATPYKVILEPGDQFFIPSLWFHNVLNLSPTVAVNLFWYHLPASAYDPKDVYGNRAPVAAFRASQSVATAVKHLRTLPLEYRHLFGRQIFAQAQDKLMQLDATDALVTSAGQKELKKTRS